MVKVSIIIPNFNHAKFLESRIQSVINQNYDDYEIIILDDCSTDNSKDIIEKYKSHPRVAKILINEKNSGSPFKQWNKGVELSRGKYIWIAESDDLSESSFLKTLVPVLDNNKNVGIVYSQSYCIDENGSDFGDIREWTNSLSTTRWNKGYFNSGYDECKRFFLYKCIIANASAVLIRKEAFIKAGYAPTFMRYCGDWLMWIKILQISDIAFVAEKLNYFRTHTQTTRRVVGKVNNAQKLYEQFLILLVLKKNFDLKYPDFKQVLEKYYYLVFYIFKLKELVKYYKMTYTILRVDKRFLLIVLKRVLLKLKGLSSCKLI